MFFASKTFYSILHGSEKLQDIYEKLPVYDIKRCMTYLNEQVKTMKKILILSTGGTIASVPTEDGLVPALTGKQMTERIPELGRLAALECHTICNLDSTNVQPEEWIQIAEEVRKEGISYDGVVILHGTDTMAYTAAALSFLLQPVKKPVILTGSQIAMEEEGSDAISNLIQAVQTAVSGVPGVFIVFAGKIIKGVRAKKMCTRELEAFHSMNEEPAGRIENGQIIWRFEECGKNTVGDGIPASQKTDYEIKLNPNIALVKLYPGIEEKLLHAVIEAGYEGIILEAFGCGGIPNYRRNLLPELERAIQKGIAVVVTTQCEYNGVNLDLYEVGVLAKKLGVLSAKDMTIEALTTKLMWVLGQTKDRGKIEEMMNTCYEGEFTVER